MMKKVVIVTKSRFSLNDASATRYINLLPMFRRMGYHDAVIVEYGHNEYKKVIDHGFYKTVSMRKRPFKHLSFASKIISRIGYEKRYYNYISPLINSDDLVIVGGNFSLKSIRDINSLVHRKGAKTILSLMEKYSSSEFIFGGAFSREYQINKQIYKNYSHDDPPVMCISSYISNLLEKKGVKTCVVPFVFSHELFTDTNRFLLMRDNKIHFLYCGRPEKKDLLAQMIGGFLLLDDEIQQSISLNIVGVSESWLKNRFSKRQIQKISEFTTFYGKKNKNFVLDIYKTTHYSILLRPFKEEYAMAGFPTKISESLFYGVPPITNLTSDLQLYLKDEFNSIIVAGENSKDFSNAVIRAFLFAKNQEKYNMLRNNAFNTSKTKLNSSAFENEISKII